MYSIQYPVQILKEKNGVACQELKPIAVKHVEKKTEK